MPTERKMKDAEGGVHEATIRTTRLNLNLPERSREELDRLSQKTNRSITELVRLGLSLVKLLYDCQAEGQKIVITDREGNPIKEVFIPEI